MRWRSASVTAFSCTLLLAGCGGGNANQTKPRPRPPRIPADVAQRLAAEADLIARAQPGSCTARAAAARLQAEALEAIQTHRVPTRYQEPLMSAANGLVARLSVCAEPTRKDDKKRHEKKKHEKDH
jgi:hypothetical protein